MIAVPDDPTTDWTQPGVFEVAPGVHRIPLPLPMDGLRAVNVYAIEDGDGLVLIDSGWAIAEARDLLEKALGTLDRSVGDVHRFLITHIHRDHYTLAVALRREFGNRVSLGLGEQPNLRRSADPGRAPLDEPRGRLIRCGARELFEKLRDVPVDHDASVWEDPDDWLESGADIALGSRSLQTLATPGHTQGHVVYLDDALCFAGDHVLPHITPSIGFEPEPGELPLGDYLDSLRLVRSIPDRRLLPAHGHAAASVHDRVDELLDHHATRLDDTAATVAQGAATAFESAGILTWTRRGRSFGELDWFNQMLAVNETGAHLDLLAVQGRLVATDVDGVRHYSPS